MQIEPQERPPLDVTALARVNVKVTTFDVATGRVLHEEEVHNLVLTVGLNLLRDAINSGTINPVTHFAVGTGTAAVAAGDTALGSEAFRDTLNTKVANSAELVCHYYLASGSANGNTLTEAALFNASSGGTPYARVLLGTPIVKSLSVATAFAWTLSWGAV